MIEGGGEGGMGMPEPNAIISSAIILKRRGGAAGVFQQFTFLCTDLDDS